MKWTSLPKRNTASARMRFFRIVLPGMTLLCSFCVSLSYGQELDRLEEIQPFTLQGNVSGTTTGYSMSGIERRQTPFSWMFTGAATATVYDVEMPFSFMFAEREREFHQPFNEFGISPSYKWVKLHLGYRSLSWSRYTMAGMRFAGAALELMPQDFQFAVMYGRLARAVEEDPDNPLAVPAYKRTGGGAMAKIGNENGFFQVSLFWALDDTASLARQPSYILPQENVAAAFGAYFVAFDWLTAELDVGACFLTNNLFSPELSGSGLSGGKQQSRVRHFKRFFDLRTSSTLSFAMKTGLLFRFPWMNARLDYEIIEPEFTAFGAYYFNSDIQNLTLAPSFQLFDGAVRVTASGGVQSDNVGNTKTATTTRLITSANIGWSPNNVWNIDAMFSNYATSQAATREPLNDSIRVRNVNTSISLTPRMMLESDALRHVVTLAAGTMVYDDMNIVTGRFSGSSTTTTSLSYNLGFKETPWTTGAAINWSNTETAFGVTKNVGFAINGATSFFESALSLSLTIGYSSITVGSADASGVLTQTLGVGYRASNDDQFTFSLTGSQNGGGSEINPAYREYTATVNYNRAISWTPSGADTP